MSMEDDWADDLLALAEEPVKSKKKKSKKRKREEEMMCEAPFVGRRHYLT